MTGIRILDHPNGFLVLPMAGVAFGYVFLKDSYLLSALVLAGIYAVVIVGLVLLSGLSGQYSLGHAAFFGLGAYTSAVLATHGVPTVLDCAIAIFVSGGIAALIAVPLVRLHGYYLSVATLTFGLIVYSVLNGWRAVTLGPSGLADIPPISIGSLAIKGDAANYWLAWSIAILATWGGINLWRSRAGQALLAVKQDATGAAAMGINVPFVKMQIFTMSAAFAGLGGALYAHYVSFIAPERFGMTTSFELLLGALLGGLGTPMGAIVGALLLIALPEIVAPLRDFKTIVYGLTFILVLLYFPDGLAGMLLRGAARVGQRTASPPTLTAADTPTLTESHD